MLEIAVVHFLDKFSHESSPCMISSTMAFVINPSVASSSPCRYISVPRYLPMKHDFMPAVIDLNYRITPTEIRVQVVELERHLHRPLSLVKTRSDSRTAQQAPFRNAFFPSFPFHGKSSFACLVVGVARLDLVSVVFLALNSI